MRQTTGYSYWTNQTGPVRQYPWLASDESCEVLVLGGGMTGALLGYRFAEDGNDVCLLTKLPVGYGATAFNSGILEYDNNLSLVQLGKSIGRQTAVDCLNRYRDALDSIETLFDELRSIYHGVYLIRDLTAKTANVIVSYGERMSSHIVSTLIDSARWYDSREFIKTSRRQGQNLVDFDVTLRLVSKTFARVPKVAVIPGFIASDVNDGETTNLGRGGSDYTAAIVASALNASALEIWTDVDGFMTADPRVIPNAYTIDELSYNEAMELCNFGAKVVYPPTIYPVRVKGIPVYVKNTFHPDHRGSIIYKGPLNDERTIKGISSIRDTSLVTVSGPSMVGVIGINRRIFTALADAGVSVFLVAQTSSEASTSLCVTDADGERAARVLDEEFAKEIATGAMNHAQLTRNLSTVAVVGDKMKHTPGIAGKLFGVLGRNGINIVAMAQGATETNVSLVVSRDLLRKSLNVIHDSFFLSEYQVLNLFICGVGTVGGMLIEQIAQQREKLMRTRGLKLNVVGIASGHYAVFDREGIDLTDYREKLKAGGPSNVERLKKEVIGMNIFNSVWRGSIRHFSSTISASWRPTRLRPRRPMPTIAASRTRRAPAASSISLRPMWAQAFPSSTPSTTLPAAATRSSASRLCSVARSTSYSIHSPLPRPSAVPSRWHARPATASPTRGWT